MKTSTILLIAAGGVAAYWWWSSQPASSPAGAAWTRISGGVSSITGGVSSSATLGQSGRVAIPVAQGSGQSMAQNGGMLIQGPNGSGFATRGYGSPDAGAGTALPSQGLINRPGMPYGYGI